MKKVIVKKTELIDEYGTPRCLAPEGTKAGAPLYVKEIVAAKSKGKRK